MRNGSAQKRLGDRLRGRNVMLGCAAAGAIVAVTTGYAATTWLIERSLPGAAASASAVTGVPTPQTDPERAVVIHGTGDVNLDPRELGLLSAGYEQPWTGVRDLFRHDDLTVINLECSPGRGGTEQEKEYRFRCPRGFTAMRESGVDVANLGNNHSMDYGKEAMLAGRNALVRAGLAPVGAGEDSAKAHQPAIFERNRRTIAVLGFGGVIPERSWIAGPGSPGMADGDRIDSMAAAVRAAEERVDIVVVTVHWGGERQTQPQGEDVGRARALIDAGADAIFGHHAHVLQPLEIYKGRPIFYGLGNFVWPRGGPTAVARVVARPDGTFGGCLLPATLSGGRPVLAGPPAGPPAC